ncbi:MAG: phosphoribosylglycinamide formyltransferase [bacterium]|nr:phosphoribosylglycinamide formyltransferase [bacterium]
MAKKTVSFLVSGRGSNFTEVAKQIHNGSINAAPGIVISNAKDAKALEVANDFGMTSYFVDPADYPTREEHERAMIELLNECDTDLIVAAGFMKILSPYFVNKYRNRVINIHPALLPSFPGVNSQKQAFDHGVKVTGCTAHFIDEGTDTGPIIMQSIIEILQDDTISTLSARILAEEHKILPESVKLFCEDKLTIEGRKVLIT